MAVELEVGVEVVCAAGEAVSKAVEDKANAQARVRGCEAVRGGVIVRGRGVYGEHGGLERGVAEGRRL